MSLILKIEWSNISERNPNLIKNLIKGPDLTSKYTQPPTHTYSPNVIYWILKTTSQYIKSFLSRYSIMSRHLDLSRYSNTVVPKICCIFQKKKSIWRDIVPTRGGGGKLRLGPCPSIWTFFLLKASLSDVLTRNTTYFLTQLNVNSQGLSRTKHSNISSHSDLSNKLKGKFRSDG